jgi:hypothetical protein
MPMKKLAVFVIIFLFSIELYANESCNKVVSGYEKSDLMYVVYPNLPNLTLEQMNAAVKAVMSQNTIVMDEILVYFVATKGDVGNDNLKPNNFVGFYYTHDSVLTLWPDIESKRKDIKINY